MRLTRIYCPPPIQSGTKITASLSASRHLLSVLRLRPGAAIEIFDGQGQAFSASLLGHEGKLAVLTVGEAALGIAPSPLIIHLGQGISRGEKMDFTVQKAVELGVHSLTPLFTEFSGVDLSAERSAKRLAHWQAIIVSACEQCGRNDLPVIHAPITLETWISQRRETLRLILEPKGTTHLSELHVANAGIALLVGPEGGFSIKESALAQQNGFLSLQLGPRVLRTETAGAAAITALQCGFGDMK